MKLETLAKLLGGAILVTGFVAIAPKGCTQPEKAKQVLESQGFKNIRITGWRPFMAGKEDAFSTGFVATSPSGQGVTGAVTGGWFKGSTVRFD